MAASQTWPRQRRHPLRHPHHPWRQGTGSATVGPYFKFEDVNSLDLNFTGKVPNRFGTGDLIHVVADIDH